MGAEQSKTPSEALFMESIEKLSKESPTVQEFKKKLEERVLKNIYPSPDTPIIKIASQRPTKPAPQSIERIELNAEPTEERNEDVVNAEDGRIQIQATAKWPHSVHGVVSCKINNINKWGTGTMIGPNAVLTAGHNLYNYKLKMFADIQSLQFLPGMNGQVIPFGPVEVEKYFVSPNYVKEEKEDYAILILKEPIGEMTGYFGLVCLDPEEIKKKRINVTGYPSDKVASKPSTYEMWGMEGIASHIDEKKGSIHYLIDTAAGQSGSGVWYREDENYYVCGIHVAGGWCANRATLLTRNAYQQIHEWIQQGNSKELFFKLQISRELRLFSKVNVECISLLLYLDNLRLLQLQYAHIGNEEAKPLAKNISWVNLECLLLSSNNIRAEGAKALAKNNYWKNLTQLSLDNNNIDDEGAKSLANNTSWKKLETLDLSNNYITDTGIKALKRRRSWRTYISNGMWIDGDEMCFKDSL